MTLSVLIQKQREVVLINQFKKAYSIFSQAVQTLNMEYDGNWENVTIEQFYDDITKQVKTIKTCRHTAGCIDQGAFKYLKGGFGSNNNEANGYKFILPDGMQIWITGGRYASSYWHMNSLPDVSFGVDINGTKKPNQIGRDVFYFFVRDGRLQPFGNDDEGESCTSEMYGYTCAYKILSEGKFTY